MSLPPLSTLADKRVVVLPDLYIDILVPTAPWPQTRARLEAIAAGGGGNLPVDAMTFKLGGNAANLGLALARLGAQVDLVAATDRMGLDLLKRAASGTGLSTRHVRLVDAPASTVSLECADANLMLSHAGPVADFGPGAVDADAWQAIQAADAVAVSNWAQNDHGTALFEAVAAALDGSQTFLFVDTADPRHRGDAARGLLEASALWHRVDAWGLNENELTAFAAAAPASWRVPREDAMDAAVALSRRLDVRLDVHTRDWAASVRGAPAARVSADPTPGRRKTGAGDAWNAGNLAGQLLDWSDEARLRLAHDVATAYVTAATGLPPTPDELAPTPLRPER